MVSRVIVYKLILRVPQVCFFSLAHRFGQAAWLGWNRYAGFKGHQEHGVIDLQTGMGAARVVF